MPMTPLPSPPSRNDPTKFAERGDAFLAALPMFVTEANALESNVNAKEISASDAAQTAITKAGEAATSEANVTSIAEAVATSAANAGASASAAATSEANAEEFAAQAAASAASIDPATLVKLAGNQTIGGVKTFSSAPVVPAGATGSQAGQAQEMAPSGQVAFFARNSAPPGWLKANGTAVSRTTFSALFDAIGTTFGAGDGSTTFNLPDLRGEFLRSWDDARGADLGRTFGSAQSGQNASHTHGVSDPGHGHSTDVQAWSNGGGNMGYLGPGSGANAGAFTWNSSWSGTGIAIQSSGGTEARPRNVALLACIKY